jgi:hypothetical protein
VSDDAAPGLLVEMDGRARRLLDPQARPLEMLPPITPVPLAPRVLMGLAQLDGEVLPVLSPSEPARSAVAILTETSLGRVLLLCTRVLAADTAPDAEPLALEPLLESIRQAVRA